MALLDVSACYFVVHIAHRATWHNYLIAYTVSGLAIWTKYNAGIVLCGIFAARLLASIEAGSIFCKSR